MFKLKEYFMNNDNKNFTVGNESVVMGNVQHNVGDRSVVIGATDQFGNTILNTPMSIGYKANGGKNGIAIGAYAGNGEMAILDQLVAIVENSGDIKLRESFNEICIEIKMPQKDKLKIKQLWENVKNADALNGCIDLVQKVGIFIAPLIN
jgi:hypothetical protein